jgi:archaellum component FlaC
MKNKNLTIDDLALMVKKGFDGVDKRFNGVDKRFDKVEKRLDKVEKRLDRIEKLILADQKERIEKLEMEVKELKALLV